MEGKDHFQAVKLVCHKASIHANITKCCLETDNQGKQKQVNSDGTKNKEFSNLVCLWQRERQKS